MYRYKLSDSVSVTSFNTKNESRLIHVHTTLHTSILCHFYVLGHVTLFLNIMHIWNHHLGKKTNTCKTNNHNPGLLKNFDKFIYCGWRGSIKNNFPTCWGPILSNGLHNTTTCVDFGVTYPIMRLVLGYTNGQQPNYQCNLVTLGISVHIAILAWAFFRILWSLWLDYKIVINKLIVFVNTSHLALIC